jgi:hypothetical protein
LLHAAERAVLAALAARENTSVARRPVWFAGHSQSVQSSTTNTINEDVAKWPGATTYKYAGYPDVIDTTEGIASAVELYRMGVIGSGAVVLDLGSGAFCRGGEWLRLQDTSIAMHAADPYNLSAEANSAAQRAVEAAGGADVVLSASVVNVIPTVSARLQHYAVARLALKPGGRAYFFVWAGDWPARGTGAAMTDAARDAHQANAWASAFIDEVAAVLAAARAMRTTTATSSARGARAAAEAAPRTRRGRRESLSEATPPAPWRAPSTRLATSRRCLTEACICNFCLLPYGSPVQ